MSGKAGDAGFFVFSKFSGFNMKLLLTDPNTNLKSHRIREKS